MRCVLLLFTLGLAFCPSMSSANECGFARQEAEVDAVEREMQAATKRLSKQVESQEQLDAAYAARDVIPQLKSRRRVFSYYRGTYREMSYFTTHFNNETSLKLNLQENRVGNANDIVEPFVDLAVKNYWRIKNRSARLEQIVDKESAEYQRLRRELEEALQEYGKGVYGFTRLMRIIENSEHRAGPKVKEFILDRLKSDAEMQATPEYRRARDKVPSAERLWEIYSDTHGFAYNRADAAFHRAILGSEFRAALFGTIQQTVIAFNPAHEKNVVGAVVRGIYRMIPLRNKEGAGAREQDVQGMWATIKALYFHREVFKNHYPLLNRAFPNLMGIPSKEAGAAAMFRLYEENAHRDLPFTERLLVSAFRRRLGEDKDIALWQAWRDQVVAEAKTTIKDAEFTALLETTLARAKQKPPLPRVAEQFITPEGATAQILAYALAYGLYEGSSWWFGIDEQDAIQAGKDAVDKLQLTTETAVVRKVDYLQALRLSEVMAAGLAETYARALEGDLEAKEDVELLKISFDGSVQQSAKTLAQVFLEADRVFADKSLLRPAD